ncbi:ATP-binding protein [Vogesella oryzae]|uniref:ATP-binding protein n=1 Tax=Vogesella oryzae TaxID=1735285 RepID=UPI00158360F8|nr:ATP-binding protein [Vogesella oryzae]
MDTLPSGGNQTAAIGRAIRLTVLVLGGLQLLVSMLLLLSGFHGYRKASEHEALNTANQALFSAGQQLERENNQTLALLLAATPPTADALAELAATRSKTDRLLQQQLQDGGAARQPAAGAMLARLQQHLVTLQKRRQQVDQDLRQRPYVFDENALSSWKLTIGPLFDTLDNLLEQDSFWLVDESDPALNRMAAMKYQVWQLGTMLQAESNALLQRAYFARPLNSTDEYELLRKQEQGQLLLGNLRGGIRFLGDAQLQQQLYRVSDLVWRLRSSSEQQHSLLQREAVGQLPVQQYRQLHREARLQLGALFKVLTDVMATRVVDYKANYRRELITNAGIALLALGLYLYLQLRMRHSILQPLQRMQRLLDAAVDAIVTVDGEQRIRVANRGAIGMFGYGRNELQDMPISRLLRCEALQQLWHSDSTGQPPPMSGYGIHADGRRFYATIALSRLPASDDGGERYMLIIRNEQERHEAEESLAHSMQLLGAIHHVESLLLARSARRTVYHEVLFSLLQYCGCSDGVILALQSGHDGQDLFLQQASIGSAPRPAWVDDFLALPVVQAMQLGQQHSVLQQDGWCFLLVHVDSRTVMVAGLAANLDALQQVELQPLLAAGSSIVRFYAEEDRRWASEHHLREVLQMEEAIYSASPVGLLRLDSHYDIVRANTAGCSLFGVADGGLHGVGLRQLLADDSGWQQVLAKLQLAEQQNSQISLEVECRHYSGQHIWVLVSGQLLLPEMPQQGLILACLDITERRAARDALSQAHDQAAAARQQLEVAIESLEEAFAFFDTADRLVLCNRRYAELIGAGLPPTGLQGWHFEQLLRTGLQNHEHPDDPFAIDDWVAERLRRHASGQASFQLNIGERWYQLSDHAIAGGGSVCIYADVTGLKQQEMDLLLARDQAEQANRAKSAFLATISHEIRTPMNGVLGMLELLALTPLDAGQRDSIDTIQDSAQTLLRLIDDILDFSKIEAGKLDIQPEPASVAKLMHKVHQLYSDMAQRKGLAFTLQVDPTVVGTLLVDPIRLRQILQNFCSNAVKFTERGEIVLRVQCLEDSDNSQTLRFDVVDSGIGIAAENLSRLFEPFTQAESTTTRRFGGSGLGLAICRSLARLMGGQVALASVPGEGTTATLQLTLAKTDAVAVPAVPAPQTLRQPSVRQQLPVLFVEDNPTNRKLTIKQFGMLGYPLEVAENGVEAMHCWQRQAYALILTDCHMPQMDGYELARTIRYYESALDDARHIPIIACTANTSQEEVEKTREAGMDDFLPKPLGLEALAAMLEKWLHHAWSPAAAPVSQEQVATASAPAPDMESQPLDRSVLAVYSSGDWSVERDILDDFLHGNDEDMAALQQAVSEANPERIVWAAHRIKGASRMVGANRLGEAAAALEAAAHAGDQSQMAAAWPALQQSLQQLRDWLQAQPA